MTIWCIHIYINEAVKPDSHMQKNETRPLSYTINKFRSSLRGSAEPNPTRNHKGSIPGLPQWVYIRVYINTMKYHSAIKKNEILPFTTIWMDLEGIMLSEVNQKRTNTA